MIPTSPALRVLEGQVLAILNDRATEDVRAAVRSEVTRAADRNPDGQEDVRRCTGLLLAADLLVAPLVADSAVATPDMLVRIAALSNDASALRARRRAAVAAALDSLEDTGDIGYFVGHIVEPMACARWLPGCVYEPPFTLPGFLWDDIHNDLWNRAASDALDALVRRGLMGGVAGLERLLADLAANAPATMPRAADLCAYLHAALAVRAGRRGVVPVAAPVLFVPAKQGWPLGHILDTLIIPAGSGHPSMKTAQALAEASLQPARRAAEEYLRRDPEAVTEMAAYGEAVVVGDYPGGCTLQRSPDDPGSLIPFEGQSAGLALAAAIVERVCGLAWQEAALVTAAIESDGTARRLGGSSGLATKGRAAALWHTHAVVVVAAGPDGSDSGDGAAVLAGAAEMGGQVSIVPVTGLSALPGTILADPFAQLLRRLSAEEVG